MAQTLTRVVYRPGPQRRGGFAAVYHEILDLYMPRIGGFLGVGYYTLLLRLVSRRPDDPFCERAYPTKRYLKDAGGIGADKLKELELRLVAWGLLEIQIERIPIRGRGGNVTTAVKYTYLVNDPLPPEAFEAAVREGRLPRPIPPALRPSWWSPDTAARLGIPYETTDVSANTLDGFPVPTQEQGSFPVPGQEQGTGFPVPRQEQGNGAVAVPHQEQGFPCSQSGTKKKKKTLTIKNNVVVAKDSAQEGRRTRNRRRDNDDAPVITLCRAYRAVTCEAMAPEQARQLIGRYTLVECLRQLRTLAWRLDRGGLDRPMAYYLKALEGRYVPGPIRRRKAERERARLELLKAQREAAAAADAAAAKKARLQRAEAILAVLPEDERQALEAEARRRLAERVGTVLSDALVRMELRMLVLRQYSDNLHQA